MMLLHLGNGLNEISARPQASVEILLSLEQKVVKVLKKAA
jgi:hypothetical protein